MNGHSPAVPMTASCPRRGCPVEGRHGHPEINPRPAGRTSSVSPWEIVAILEARIEKIRRSLNLLDDEDPAMRMAMAALKALESAKEDAERILR